MPKRDSCELRPRTEEGHIWDFSLFGHAIASLQIVFRYRSSSQPMNGRPKTVRFIERHGVWLSCQHMLFYTRTRSVFCNLTVLQCTRDTIESHRTRCQVPRKSSATHACCKC
ncbi:uncharacterized protein LOC120285049 [Drosophila simulans]|uniref:uncharacterized protein LOC120285049 n=1 Tax=Drosophila simulans TaxID=7240 RepID=UPI00192D1876|nr:uncharacterized protein LOC120285049 [Drosophila simulans]